jgi:nucleoside phosphorylase
MVDELTTAAPSGPSDLPHFDAPLIVSALPAEQAALRRHLSAPTTGPTWRLDRPEDARVIRGVVTGDGAGRARAGLEAALREAEPTIVVVIGLAGGLSPDAASGALFVGRRILDATAPDFEVAAHPLPLNNARAADVASAPAIVGLASDKADLWRQLGSPSPALVDLESATYARVATERGLPIAVLRVVSDAADEDLPPAIAASVDAWGSVRPLRVALTSALRPTTWPQLAALGRRLQLGAEALARALAPLL